MIIYIILVKPFEKPKLNYLEIFNELCILAAAYHLVAFTNFLDSPEIQYQVGWSNIGITTFNIVVNMIVMIVETVGLLKVKGRALIHKWRKKKVQKASMDNTMRMPFY